MINILKSLLKHKCGTPDFHQYASFYLSPIVNLNSNTINSLYFSNHNAFHTIPIAFENDEDQLESACSHHSISIPQDQYPDSKDNQQRYELNTDFNIGHIKYREDSKNTGYLFPQTVYIEEKSSIDEMVNTSSPTTKIYKHISKSISSIQSKNKSRDLKFRRNECSELMSLSNDSCSDEKKQTKKRRKHDLGRNETFFPRRSGITVSNTEEEHKYYKNIQNSKPNEENIPGLANKIPTNSFQSQENDHVQNKKMRDSLHCSEYDNKSNIKQSDLSIHKGSGVKTESFQESKSIYHSTKHSSQELHVSRTSERKVCHCKKSKCLKLYCECFAASMYCDPNLCACFDCYNLEVFNEKRQKAIDNALSRNPDAFAGKLSKAKKRAEMLKSAIDGGWTPSINEFDANKLSTSSSGCNCKKSRCLKKYCDCFYVQAYCSEWCKCRNCLNYEGSEKRIEALKKKRNDEEKEQERYEKSRNRRQFKASTEPHQFLKKANNDQNFTKSEEQSGIAFACENEIEFGNKEYEDSFVLRNETSDDDENEKYNIPITMV